MTLPTVVSREQWLAARTELLVREKAMTRARDVLNADRRRLPMVRIDTAYEFEGPHGRVGLHDLFGDARQLVVQHVMFDPAWDAACPGCSAGLDELSPAVLDHLAERDTSFAAVSRAPYPKLAETRTQRGWTFPWYSSFGSSFNYDFHVSLDETVAPVVLNYRDAAELRAAGLGWATEGPSEQPGLSCFLREGDDVFHTYSTFGRGTEAMGGTYAVLDLTALGRQEEWEEPKGRVAAPHPADPSFTS
jgi:predicted dithiol-disulfide oxidoreductase (DUF899 family)